MNGLGEGRRTKGRADAAVHEAGFWTSMEIGFVPSFKLVASCSGEKGIALVKAVALFCSASRMG